jgi:hypothetical protein
MGSKFLMILAFALGIPVGFKGMEYLNNSFILEREVLSATNESENQQMSNVSTETFTLTLTPSPTLTHVPSPTPTLTITVTPTQTPHISSPVDLEPLFAEFSSFYNVDSQFLKRIAKCESNFNVGVWSEPYAGLYQFHEVTWTNFRNQMGKDPNINLRFGARESIETAAYVLSVGKSHIWPNCAK